MFYDQHHIKPPAGLSTVRVDHSITDTASFPKPIKVCGIKMRRGWVWSKGYRQHVSEWMRAQGRVSKKFSKYLTQWGQHECRCDTCVTARNHRLAA